MFQEVLRDPEICTELVERLLHVRVKHIEYPELEKTIAPYYTTKGVRLDVYLKEEIKLSMLKFSLIRRKLLENAHAIIKV